MPDLPRKALLAVTGAHPPFYPDGKRTGLDYSEALHPYTRLHEAGFEVDIASENGTFGWDEHSLSEHYVSHEDYATLHDENNPFNQKINQQLYKAGDLSPHEYGLFYAAGGPGCMYDFPHARHLQAIAEDIYNRGGVVSAVGHGPAIFAGMHGPDGEPLIKDKTITGFVTKGEVELKVIDRIRDDHVQTIEELAAGEGANYVPPGHNFDDSSKVDSRIVTGANPKSTESTVRNAIRCFESAVHG